MLRAARSCDAKNAEALIAGLLIFRVLLIAAHPDDETIGAGVLLSHLKAPHVVHVSDGSPLNLSDALAAGFSTREGYAAARKAEALRALATAGVREHQIESFGFIDQGVCFCLLDLTHKILDLLRRIVPDVVLTHAYEGGHPDHDSAAFASRMAIELLCAESYHPPPQLYEFAGYNGRGGRLRTYEFLHQPAAPEYRLHLNSSERSLKTQMFGAFASQARTLQPFLPPTVEVFRKAPHYDFTRPPHPGKLFYENFDWGVDGRAWCALASAASHELRLVGTAGELHHS